MRFDWYQTTINRPSEQVVETLSKLGHELRPDESIARLYRYQNGYRVHHHVKGTVATILTGPNHRPHAFASSDNTMDFVDLVRSSFGADHYVTRVDSCHDVSDPGAYDKLRRVCRSVAKEHRLKFPSITDSLDNTAGRTQYIGSPSSDYRSRLYEKGLQVLADTNLSVITPDTLITLEGGEKVRAGDWVRLELQARPRSPEGRQMASEMSPEEVWSLSGWSRRLAEKAMALRLEAVTLRARKLSPDDKMLSWMCRQYGKLLVRMEHDLGSWAAVGLQIGDVIAEMERSRVEDELRKSGSV